MLFLIQLLLVLGLFAGGFGQDGLGGLDGAYAFPGDGANFVRLVEFAGIFGPLASLHGITLCLG